MSLLERIQSRKAEGARLRAFRASRGWTQGQLAQHLHLHENTVARMERGVVRITGRTWAQLTAMNGGREV